MDLRVTDGVTNVVLDGTAPVVGCIYFPDGPNPDAPGEPISEAVEVSLSGTVATIRATLRSLNLLFLAAQERAEQGVGPRIFVEYAPTAADSLYRSEILRGGVEWSDNKALRNLADAQAATVVVVVTWVRAPFWESQLTQATLTNGNGTNNISGLTIRLHDDGTAGHDNYVEIDAAEVTGDLLAPAEIHLKNTFGAGVNYRNFYLANNWFDATLAHVIEGESRDAGYGSVGASSAASNGQYAQFSVNGTLEVPWTLAATTLQKTRGRYLRVLAKFFFFDQFANVYVTAKIKDAAGNITLAQAEEEVRLQPGAGYLQNLGVLPFPPGGYSTAPSSHKLVLAIRTESLQTVSVDFMQLTPTFPPGGYREIKQLGNVVPNNEKFVDDGIEGISYVTVSGQQHFVSAPKTEPLLLWPGRTQRIYVLADGTDVTIDHTMQVQVWFRARRATI
jgi:hypothetical protein